MKNPNGAGSVYKLSGKRRKPWGARITIGHNPDTGSPIQRLIGTYETRKEAMDALAAARVNPIPDRKITLRDVYEQWSAKKYPTLATLTVTSYRRGWDVLRPIHKANVATIKLGQLQAVFDAARKPINSLRIAQVVLSQVIAHAIRHEYTPSDRRDMVRYIDLSHAQLSRTVDRAVFTADEIARLWDAEAHEPLTLIYTGMRIGEYLALTPEDILPDRLIIRQSKTAAGVREIPLLPRIAEIICVPTCKYSSFHQHHWQPLMERLEMRHTIHDTRHTFATLCTEAGMDARILKVIIGHSTNDITESVYTHLSFDVLKTAMMDALPL